jgi:hypothetical protein
MYFSSKYKPFVSIKAATPVSITVQLINFHTEASLIDIQYTSVHSVSDEGDQISEGHEFNLKLPLVPECP